MDLLKEDHLPFGKIADEWARELKEAKTPGRHNRNEIFLEMIRGGWRDQFADTELTKEQAPRYDKDGHRYKPAPMRVTRETLDKMVLLRSGVRRCDPDASRWEFRVSLTLEDYEPLSLRVWFEPLTISREDFGQWCDDYAHARPAFWFGDARAGAPHPGAAPFNVRERRAESQGRHENTKRRKTRTRDARIDADVKSKIQSVLAAANSRWPKDSKLPRTAYQAAKLLVDGQPGKRLQGYSQITIRKILDSTYKPMRAHDLSGRY